MKPFLLMFTLLLCVVDTKQAMALDCSAPAPIVSIRLYVGSEYDLKELIAPGEKLPTITTCAVGSVTDSVTERQWPEVEAIWAKYEEASLKILKPPAIFTEAKVLSFSIGKIAFVNLGRNYKDNNEAAVSIASIVAYSTRSESEGNVGPVMQYDMLQWSPHQVSQRLAIVYDDGQIVSAKVDAWRESCGNQKFVLYQLGTSEYSDYQFAVEGMEDICSVTMRELAPAHAR